MGFMWGSFADGFTRGFQNGWDLGDKITKAWDKAKFKSATAKADADAEQAYADLDHEKSAAGERRKARETKGEKGSLMVNNDFEGLTPTSPTNTMDVGGTKINTDPNYLSNIQDQAIKPYEIRAEEYGSGTIPRSETPQLGMDMRVLDGQYTLTPHNANDEQAVKDYMETGRHYGQFDTPDEAVDAAVRIDADQKGRIKSRQDEMGSVTFDRDAYGLVRPPQEQATVPRERAVQYGAPDEESIRQEAIPRRPADADADMSTEEYARRHADIQLKQKRDTLKAQLEYYRSQDPEKYMEAKKGLYDLDTDDNIRKVITGAMNGDSASLGIMVKTLQQAGYFPDGAQFSEGSDGGVRVTDANGKVLWDGQITPQMVQKAIPMFAMAQKYLSNRDYASLVQLQQTQRTSNREDEKLNLEKIKTNQSQALVDLKLWAAEQGLAGKGGKTEDLKFEEVPSGDGKFSEFVVKTKEGDPQARVLVDTETHQRIRIPYTWTTQQYLKYAENLEVGDSLAFSGDTPVVVNGKTGQVTDYDSYAKGTPQWSEAAPAEAEAPKPRTPGQRNVAGATYPAGENPTSAFALPGNEPAPAKSEAAPAEAPSEESKTPAKVSAEPVKGSPKEETKTAMQPGGPKAKSFGVYDALDPSLPGDRAGVVNGEGAPYTETLSTPTQKLSNPISRGADSAVRWLGAQADKLTGGKPLLADQADMHKAIVERAKAIKHKADDVSKTLEKKYTPEGQQKVYPKKEEPKKAAKAKDDGEKPRPIYPPGATVEEAQKWREKDKFRYPPNEKGRKGVEGFTDPRTLARDSKAPSGKVSRLLESSGDPGAISDAKKDPIGGKSYGVYQFSLKQGTLNEFMRFYGSVSKGDLTEWDSKASKYVNIKPGTDKFDAWWKKEAETNPDFAKAQHAFVVEKYYTPLAKWSKKSMNFDLNNAHEAVREVFLASAVHMGTERFENWMERTFGGNRLKSMTDREIINRVIQMKIDNVDRIWASSPREIRDNMKNIRFPKERQIALEIRGSSPAKRRKY